MRINHPVNGVEYPFPPGQTLVSSTDLKGRITYCNPPFIEVSGFDKHELLGQPHNLIRHPDMPEEAFRDLWQTIAGGQPWSAPIKNRRKDGSYYWVMANVTPLVHDGVPVGYMSVRTQVTREQVQSAEALYQLMRDERKAGSRLHRLDAGQVCVDNLAGRLQRLMKFGPAWRTALATGLLTGLTGLTVAVVLRGGSLGSAYLAIVALLAGAAGLGAGLLGLGRSGEAALRRAVDTANRMAAGDLTQRFETQGSDTAGRLQRALAQLNVNLQAMVRDARTQIGQIRAATGEIAAGNLDLSGRTESQAASLQQTAASMEEITSTVRNGVHAAARAAELAGQASSVTQQGSDAIGEVTQTMHLIAEASKRISEIIGVIDAIAFQTNILALNAAVEAARAGEQGSGFAVVASEVRALAQRSSTAAREIKQLIEQARQTMGIALQSVREVTVVISDISRGANEQLHGISQINEAVSQMDAITQQNAALVEQVAASATQLQGQAESVNEAVQMFRLDARQSVTVPDAVALRRAAREAASAELV